MKHNEMYRRGRQVEPVWKPWTFDESMLGQNMPRLQTISLKQEYRKETYLPHNHLERLRAPLSSVRVEWTRRTLEEETEEVDNRVDDCAGHLQM